MGWTVDRITVVRDSLTAIRESVSEALNRKPKFILTLGGLGPTYDDMTLKGVSLATGRTLALNRDALGIVLKRYSVMERAAGLTVHRRKMAMLPRGAVPLPNPIGTAPGVLLRAGNISLVSFPGVPTEMKAIFKDSVLPMLKKSGAKSPSEVYVMIVGIFESSLAPILEKVRGKFSSLYFKSHPIGRETGVRSLIKLHVYTTGESDKTIVKEAVAQLFDELGTASKLSA